MGCTLKLMKTQRENGGKKCGYGINPDDEMNTFALFISK